MEKFIKNRIYKLIGFLFIGLVAVGAAFLARLVAGWFHYDEAHKEAISKSVGDGVIIGLLCLCGLVGVFVLGRQFMAELRGKSSPPPLPPKLPRFPSRSAPNRGASTNEPPKKPKKQTIENKGENK